MNDREKNAHLVSVEQQVKRCTPEQALGFGLLCIERMLPVYARASVGRAWARSDVLRLSVDEAWSLLASGGRLRAGIGEACRVAIPPDDELVDTEAVAAHLIANAVADFLAETEASQPEYAHFMAARAIELLEMLEDDSSTDPLTVERLLRAEVSRQEADLSRLQSADAAEIGLGARPSVGAQSVLGEEWFGASQ